MFFKKRNKDKNDNFNDVMANEHINASDFLENSHTADIIRHESALAAPEFGNSEFAEDYANGINGTDALNAHTAEMIRHESAMIDAEFAEDYESGLIDGGVTDNAHYHNMSDYRMITKNDETADYQGS